MKYITLIAVLFLCACGGGSGSNSAPANNDTNVLSNPSDEAIGQVLSPYSASSGEGWASCKMVSDDIGQYIEFQSYAGHDSAEIYRQTFTYEGAIEIELVELFIRGDQVTFYKTSDHCRWEWALL